MLLECPRCHYSTDKKSNYIKHLKKQKECVPTFSNKPSEHILEDFIEEKDALRAFKCTNCDKSFSHNRSLQAHTKEAHPDTIEHVVIDPSKQPLIDFALGYKAKKKKYIEECEAKWVELHEVYMKNYMKECMEKFGQENNTC
jgi:uncharacterized C2H2 Zn-finger protein